jgi:hypothetical protein
MSVNIAQRLISGVLLSQNILSPVVDNIHARSAVAGFVRLVHGDALKCGSEAACQHLLLCFMPRQVNAGFDSL